MTEAANSIQVTEFFDGLRKDRIAFGAAGQPALQSFEIEEAADLGIGVRHVEEQIAELRDRGCRRAVEDGEVAVIVGRGLGDAASGAGGERTFLHEEEMVAIDEAGGIAVTAQESARGIAFAADVVAVFAAQGVELDNLEIPVRLKALLCQKVERDERGLRGIMSSDGHAAAFQIGDGVDRIVIPHNDERGQVAIGIAHT